MERRTILAVLVIGIIVIGGMLAKSEGSIAVPSPTMVELAPADVGTAAAALGLSALDSAPTPIVVPTPPDDAEERHSRADCPTGGIIRHGDGNKTPCPLCDPPYSVREIQTLLIFCPESDRAPAPIVRRSLAEQLGVDDPSLAAPSWTFPGEIRSHLASAHGIEGASSLSPSEAVALHNRIHNAERRGIPVGAVSLTQDCPNGVCPTGDCPDGVCPTGDCPSGTCPSSSVGPTGGGEILDRVRSIRPLRRLQGFRSKLFRRGCSGC